MAPQWVWVFPPHGFLAFSMFYIHNEKTAAQNGELICTGHRAYHQGRAR